MNIYIYIYSGGSNGQKGSKNALCMNSNYENNYECSRINEIKKVKH